MLSYFYCTDQRSSHEQLRADFGAYPPTGLACTTPDVTFSIVRARGPGGWLYTAIRVGRIMRALREAPHELCQWLHLALERLETPVPTAGEKPPLGGFQIGTKRYFLPSWAIASILYVLLWKRDRANVKVAGQVMPVTTVSREMRLLPGLHAPPEETESVIRHEHIHVLQNVHEKSGITDIAEAPLLLEQNYASDPDTLYLFNRWEMEARLHEVLTWAYRANGRLPDTVEEFLTMICGWRATGELLLVAAQINLPHVAPPQHVFDAPCMLAEQMAIALDRTRIDALPDFVCQVLPVMYANLLRYYGDTAASDHITAQIARPNFYDQLYPQRDLDELFA